MMLEQALKEENKKNREYRMMRRLYGVNDERTQMAKIRYNHVCDKFGLWELVNLLWLRNINKEGMAVLG